MFFHKNTELIILKSLKAHILLFLLLKSLIYEYANIKTLPDTTCLLLQSILSVCVLKGSSCICIKHNVLKFRF